MFGRSYERLGQERRVKVLSAYGIITQFFVEDFETIRLTRNKYLHRWSQDHKTLSIDAEKCFRAATRLVVLAMGLDLQDGKIVVNPRLLNYLQDEGVYEPDQDSAV